ncbi:MAG TPA: trypsin-like peptidase domain-containing protein [Candidatus Sulfotelmatobacter sp.]|nr:trypsin-like peptidase domain-containing protein [Candidatus Sulfotelmatobacter sp.]
MRDFRPPQQPPQPQQPPPPPLFPLEPRRRPWVARLNAAASRLEARLAAVGARVTAAWVRIGARLRAAATRWRARILAAWRRIRRLAIFAAGVAAAFVAVFIYNALEPPPAPLTANDVNQAIASALASQTPGPPLSEAAYQAIRPALVVIQTKTAAAGPAASSSTGSSAAPGPSAAAGGALGSGFILDAQGEIMTSLHVVADATAIQVTYADGTTSTATVVTRAADQDIAVLQPAQLPADVSPATLGNPRTMQVGSDAFVVGNPFGLAGSMSAGVVSGLDRDFQEPDGGPLLHGLIQVDAAINPGASGGPLVDQAGRVVGVVTGLINPTSQDVFIGIGFAVPINVAGGAAGLPQD